jgi:hypothetical protein
LQDLGATIAKCNNPQNREDLTFHRVIAIGWAFLYKDPKGFFRKRTTDDFFQKT